MCFEHFWISLTIIVIITNQSSSQYQLGNACEHQKNDTIQDDLANTLKCLQNVSYLNASQISFESMLADSMKNFLPLSIENKNCIRDGYHYMTGLQNQSRWAIQSK